MSGGIPGPFIDTLRERIDILEVIRDYVTLRQRGQNYVGLCPFHSEKTPSFNVNPQKQIFHCFGCGQGGNVFTFVMKQEGISFPEAVRLLARRAGLTLQEGSRASAQAPVKERYWQLYEFAAHFYHERLLKAKDAEEARHYLFETRGIHVPIAERFLLGYAGGEWDRLARAALKEGFSQETLISSGLCRQSGKTESLYDLFRHRLIFPIFGLQGRVIAFGGRALKDEEVKYLNSPESPIFQKGQTLYGLNFARNCLSKEGKAMVVEGYFDLLRLFQEGMENSVASLGTAFTPAQADLLKRYVKEVVLIYDSDQAGLEAAQRGVEVMMGRGLKVKVMVLPEEKDPDEFLRNKGPQAFQGLMSQAKHFIHFFVEKASQERKESGGYQEAEVAQRLFSLIAELPSEIMQRGHLKMLSEAMKISEEVVVREFLKHRSSQEGPSKRKKASLEVKAHPEVHEKDIIRYLLEEPRLIAHLRDDHGIGEEHFTSEPCRVIVRLLYSLDPKGISPSQLFDLLEDEEAAGILSEVLSTPKPGDRQKGVDEWAVFLKRRERKKQFEEVKNKIFSGQEEERDLLLLKEHLESLKRGR